MIKIKNVKTLSGKVEDHIIQSDHDVVLDVQGKLTLLPALIDAHVHFRTPGAEHKEDWQSGAQAALAGGVTTVFDMPNNIPACISQSTLDEKKKTIDHQLAQVKIPLRYYLYLGADQSHLEEIGKLRSKIIGVKVYMGASTGGLVMTDPAALDRTFQMAAQADLIVAVHAEDEKILQERAQLFKGITDPSIHSQIRDRAAAIKAVNQAIDLAEKYSAQLFVLHVSTAEEIDLIRKAKQNGILVYAEATPHHLFLNENDYRKWGSLVQMNPPLRTREDQEALWEAIRDGTIDSIGSDHAPHTLEEKKFPYGSCPAGVPGIETLLPLLLDAYHQKMITLEKIVALTRTNIESIFRLEHNDDVVLVDLEKIQEVRNEALKTKCGWSPFAGRKLRGWPVYTVLKGQVFHNTEEGYTI